MKGSQSHKNYHLIAKNLTHHEVVKRLDLYSKGDEKQFFKIQKIKKEYQKEIKDREDKRIASNIFHDQGWRKGLHPDARHRIENDRELRDQILRDETVEAAKNNYRLFETHSKQFNESTDRSNDTKAYKQLASLMAEYNAVKDVKNRAGELIKRAQEDPEFVPTSSAAKTLHPNQEILSRNRKTLSGYFNKHVIIKK